MRFGDSVWMGSTSAPTMSSDADPFPIQSGLAHRR
ncbi:hypothetical protein CUAC110533_02610 [Cutibacterium acnes subsp. elongatum]